LAKRKKNEERQRKREEKEKEKEEKLVDLYEKFYAVRPKTGPSTLKVPFPSLLSVQLAALMLGSSP
jgi:hypothetical protein